MTVPAPPQPTAPAVESRRGFLRTAAPWALSVLLVVAAWFLTQLQQPEDAVYESFITSTSVGKPAEARNLAATVTDVRAARTVTDTAGWRAEGTWLIVDLDAAAVQSSFGATLHARLQIGDRLFSATERGATARGLALKAGVPRHGSLAFEVPEDAIEGPATLTLSWQGDDTADGVIEVVIDLDDVTMQNEAALAEIGWAR